MPNLDWERLLREPRRAINHTSVLSAGTSTTTNVSWRCANFDMYVQTAKSQTIQTASVKSHPRNELGFFAPASESQHDELQDISSVGSAVESLVHVTASADHLSIPSVFTQAYTCNYAKEDKYSHTPNYSNQLAPSHYLVNNQLPSQEKGYDLTDNEADDVIVEHDRAIHQVSPSSRGVHNTLYVYTSDLLSLEAHRPLQPRALPPQCGMITTPLIVNNWSQALRNHTDKQFVDYILNSLAQGFHIGINPNHRCMSCKDNMRSAYEHPQPVEDYLATELAAGRIAGPFDPDELQHVTVSRFGVIPKANQAGKWRLILDLSSPKDSSVNDGIQGELCSLVYISTDDAVEKAMELGKGALLAKVDVEHAYRNIPVHPDDRSLIAMTWKEKIYVDTVLPFGLRSAPKIFSAVADALEWILLEQGISVCLHYLDDFLTMGKANTEECERNLQLIKRICEFLGVPLKVEKIEGPSSILVFLGILLDTTKQEISLPHQKLEELKRLVTAWRGRSSCTKRELLQLIGKLAHATKVVVPGRTFLRRMIDTSMTVKHLDHHIKLRSEFASDLAWWDCFLPIWNAKSMMAVHGRG